MTRITKLNRRRRLIIKHWIPVVRSIIDRRNASDQIDGLMRETAAEIVDALSGGQQ
jgi:hypothetical protein